MPTTRLIMKLKVCCWWPISHLIAHHSWVALSIPRLFVVFYVEGFQLLAHISCWKIVMEISHWTNPTSWEPINVNDIPLAQERCANIGYSSEAQLKLKSPKISSVHNIRFSSPIILKFCKAYGNIGAICWLWKNLMSERVFTISGFKTSFGRISYIAQPQCLLRNMRIDTLFRWFPSNSKHNVSALWRIYLGD